MSRSISNEEETLSLEAPLVNDRPGVRYSASQRVWQGIPGIERARNGRLFATWYSGGHNEGPENYILLAQSDDDGFTWSDPLFVIDPPLPVRAFDPVLWHDPDGVLWWFWSQSYGLFDGRAGVWAIRCLDSAAETLTWTSPRRIFDGVMMNRPTLLESGTWLALGAVWSHEHAGFAARNDMIQLRFSNVYESSNRGETWNFIGQADVPGRTFDEHMVIERRDGSLWMLVRTDSGIGEAISCDRGKTWLSSRGNILEGPSSRFFIRRLQSGRLLLVNHYRFDGRNNLTAMLSEDEGRTWYGHLVLDERPEVSYPDLVESPEGICYLVYDRERTKAREILLAVFNEEDVASGRPIHAGCRLKQLVNRVPG